MVDTTTLRRLSLHGGHLRPPVGSRHRRPYAGPPAMTDLDTLAALAEGATPGQWYADMRGVEYEPGRGWYVLTGHGDNEMWIAYTGPDFAMAPEDAAYIASADPTTILALLARLRAAEAVCAAAGGYLAHDGSGIKDPDPAWRGDYDARLMIDARVLLRAALAAWEASRDA